MGYKGEFSFRVLKLFATGSFEVDNILFVTAAMEVLTVIGFSEDVILDKVGRIETNLVLKRNDPGLLI